MWFKNLQIYLLPKNWDMTAERLAELLEPQIYSPCSSMEASTMGWVPPREGHGLVYAVGKQWLLSLCTEKKLLPSSVVKQLAKDKAKEIEEQQGFKPGRKQMKELQEQIYDELLPKAFSTRGMTRIWIDPINGWLVVDSGSTGKADDILKLLIKAIEKLDLRGLQTEKSPGASMTTWLELDEAPPGFTIDQDTELKAANSDSKATVRYAHHALENKEIRSHIKEGGKQCTKLALTWSDRISFLLDYQLIIKRVSPLDVLKEDTSTVAADADERFDADFTLMTGELNKLMSEMIAALGGVKQEATAE